MSQKAAKAARSGAAGSGAARGSSDTPGDELSYSIELWDGDDGLPQRLLARAFNSALARAIFQAAQNEYPQRRIVLRCGARTIADSAN